MLLLGGIEPYASSHHCYVDSVWSVVGTPGIGCGTCLGYEVDEMWCRDFKILTIRWSKRSIYLVHSVDIEGLGIEHHGVRCWRSEYLNEEGRECCFAHRVFPNPVHESYPDRSVTQ